MNDIYKHYRQQKHKINPPLIKMIINSKLNAIDNDDNDKNKKPSERNAENKLPERQSQRRKQNQIQNL